MMYDFVLHYNILENLNICDFFASRIGITLLIFTSVILQITEINLFDILFS